MGWIFILKNDNLEYWKFFEEISYLPRHINSPSYDFAMDAIAERYNLEVKKFQNEKSPNGWEIPPKYQVEEAYIKVGGDIIFDGTTRFKRNFLLKVI